MMADIRESWREVASKAEALGLKLKLHLEQEEVADDTARPSTRAAIDDLGNRLKEAFESFGAAAKDPAVRSDVTEIGIALKDALVTTFSSVGSDVGGAVKDVTEAMKKAGPNRSESTTPKTTASDAGPAATPPTAPATPSTATPSTATPSNATPSNAAGNGAPDGGVPPRPAGAGAGPAPGGPADTVPIDEEIDDDEG